MAKKALVKAKSAKKELISVDRSVSIYNKMLDEVEKDVGISSEDIHNHRLSTGILAFDLTLSGGMRSGMITLVGQEASAKSTMLTHIMYHGMKEKIPVLELQDSEGSTDPQFTGAIMRVNSLTDVFGKKRDGIWIAPPLIRYYDDNIIETTYDRIAKTLNRMPDKIYRPDLDQWFLVVDPNNPKLSAFNAKTLGDPNSKLSSKSKDGKLWFPTDNKFPQAIFGIDSYPLLLPEGTDDNEESSKALAQQARAYSQQLPRVVGKLRKKHVLIVGTNQIRENPGVRFGDPRYEPAGSALRYNSSVRSWFTSRGVPDEWKGKDTKVSEEPSVEARGTDQYAYKHIGNKKCKWGTPFLETWIRVWVSDHQGKGRGIDPVYDSFIFLQEVGLVTRSKSKGSNMVNFVKGDHPFSGISFEWLDFKTLILAEEYKTNDLKEKAEKVRKKYKISKPYMIRKSCHQLLASGKASLAMSDSKTKKLELKALKVKSMDDDLEG